MAKRDVQELIAALNAIPKQIRTDIMPAIEKGVDEMVGRMKYLAPDDDGTLKASIRKTRGQVPLAIRVEAGGAATTKPVRHGVSATYDYALGQEYGTAEMPAQPFFWPSVRTTSKRVRRRIETAITKAINKAWGK